MSYQLVFTDLTSGKVQGLDALISDADAQVRKDYAKHWGLVTVTFRIASEPGDRGENEISVNFRDDISEAPGALAYHQVVNGVPDIEIGVGLTSSLKSGTDSLWSVTMHEILELLGDPGANGWKDNGKGVMVAEEGCDKVQNTGYESESGGTVTNFLLPAYFVPGAPGPWDFMGLMSSQDDVSHGYEIQASTPMGVVEIGNMMTPYSHGRVIQVVGTLTEWQKRRKSHPYARSRRRGVVFTKKVGK